ncbi:MAG: NAD(P)/FAD-dependent oxidoreductase [Patescibacteria group bacterium]|nr:NAD(P)/FAD-dependent oxidoreductase [Patescibacteria group bacterium]
MQKFDVVIVGASFSGLTLAHHLPKELSVLVVDQKPKAGSIVESTGLITSKTYNEFKTFFDIDKYITNSISSICVVAPNFKDYFISNTEQPWIYQTDTRGLVGALADSLPGNVMIKTGVAFRSAARIEDELVVKLQYNGDTDEVVAKFLVGADGSRSSVAKAVDDLSTHQKFLFGYEKVIHGKILLGENPEETIYHYWFGSFSLGYGGWISPTFIEDKPAFRIGLAKHMKDKGEAVQLLDKFINKLREEKMIEVDDSDDCAQYAFGGIIPIDGVLKNIARDNVMLIGDAAGYCGAFAADGIKGSVISGKESAKLIGDYFAGDKKAAESLNINLESQSGLISYYKKQLRYRWLWDQMKRNRTFTAMYSIIQKERESFLNQFCDSKDSKKSLTTTVLRVKYLPSLIKYLIFILIDMAWKPKAE